MSVSMARVNLLALPVSLLVLAGVLIPFWLLWGGRTLLAGARTLMTWYNLVPGVLGGIILHEVIHALSWALFGRKPLRAIRFGVQWKVLTPYAHCTEPMQARAYRLGAAMPAIILGVLPALAGLGVGSGGWTVYGVIFLIAAAGDFIVLWVLRGVPGDVLVEDHPTRAGCYVYDLPPDCISQTNTVN